MQLKLAPRSVLSGPNPSGLSTNWVSVEGTSLIVPSVNVYAVDGTSPNLSVTFETSEDGGETIEEISGPTLSLGVAGRDAVSIDASVGKYGSHIRAVVTISGTTPVFEYALFLGTFLYT